MKHSHVSPHVPDRQPACERPSAGVYALAVALLCWLAIPWWVLLGTTSAGELIFGICVAFTVIGFGIAGLSIVRAQHSRSAGSGRKDGKHRSPEDRARLGTWTGELPMSQAALQILLIPGVVALAFTALAIVDVIDRA